MKGPCGQSPAQLCHFQIVTAGVGRRHLPTPVVTGRGVRLQMLEHVTYFKGELSL